MHPRATGEGGWQARPFLATPSQERNARPAPNGRYVAYVSDESGRPEVYVQPFPDGGQRITVSTEGGQAPVWSRDGSELFYVDPAETLVAVDVSTAGEFTINEVVRLFHKALLAHCCPN